MDHARRRGIRRLGPLARRWSRYNFVGIMGFLVQICTLTLLAHGLRLPDAAAVAIAVSVALAHNFLWHERWTWRGRPAQTTRLQRFAWFQLANGSLSLGSNLGLTLVIKAMAKLPLVTANVAAVAMASLVMFLVNDRLIFRLGLSPLAPALVADDDA